MSVSNYILLGPPGSGKSTQAEMLKQELGLVHIDTGSYLRAAAEEDTAFGRELNDIINVRKELVPDRIVYTVLSKALSGVSSEKGVLIDGAPRRLSQVDEVLEALSEQGRELTKAIFLDLSESESVERISKRFLCGACHEPYILGMNLHNPASEDCAKCGGKITQRKDDTPEGVLKRFQIFEEDTLPVIDHFEKSGLLLRIDGNRGAEAISEDILKAARP